ncbi:MAG: MOSC domain-containing protein [Pseudomonadota bacterium]
MMARHVRSGRVDWIGLRPARREGLRAVERCWIGAEGLEGDHGRPGKRAVTLIQAEHLPVIAGLAGVEVTPGLLRRNIVVSGINLTALRGAVVTLGTARLEISTPCHPCSRMEEALGPGGYNAMRGHGGMCAAVLEPGEVTLGDALAVV